MSRTVAWPPSILLLQLLLAACASRPVNPPIDRVDENAGYRYEIRAHHFADRESLVILAFSGGGTRAAAFSYGVLEVLRRTEVVGPEGRRVRLLDGVDVITGVSGGSFTALAYGLYGDKLFDSYEQRFLKRDVQGDLLERALDPIHWAELSSPTWGRSELAEDFYDEILFDNATFADLERGSGPFIVVTATDISTGSRLPFVQGAFDVLCSDLGAMRLSRAAAASSAVPLVLSPVTLNNYGGTCHYAMPGWMARFDDERHPLRPAQRALRRLKEIQSFGDGADRPFVHLVDGGLADNLGMRGVLEALEALEAFREAGIASPLDQVRRIVVFIVNSLSTPETRWDQSERAPGDIALLLKATGVPIDHYSYEAEELLKDIMARWHDLRIIRDSPAVDIAKDPVVARLTNVPNAEIIAIDVSFAALPDAARRAYLNNLPTSFGLPAEAVDRLRAAAGEIVLGSPEFQRLLRETGAHLVERDEAVKPAP